MEFVSATNGEMSGDVLKDFDALILLAPKFTEVAWLQRADSLLWLDLVWAMTR